MFSILIIHLSFLKEESCYLDCSTQIASIPTGLIVRCWEPDAIKYGKIGTERSTKYSQKAFTAGPEFLGFSANVSKTSGPKAHYSGEGHGMFNCRFVSCITPAATKKIFYNSKLFL